MSVGATWSKTSKPRNKHVSVNPCTRPWTGIQIASHVCVFYAIVSFATVIQPEWLASEGLAKMVLVGTYWLVIVVDLALYAYVCAADTSYRPSTLKASLHGNCDFEPRKCEDCLPDITRTRVKHCQTCGKCTEEFDHHCRYLNVCIGGRTYRPWFVFVMGLLFLMGTSALAASSALHAPEPYALWLLSPAVFYLLVFLQALVAGMLTLFLMSLLGQHLYFVFEGMTTLEYVKDQAKGFPALPPRGWREAVNSGECYACGEDFSTLEVEDPNEVWFCTVCQADIGKAGIEFFTCDRCDNVNVCPLCRDTARDPSIPVVTYRVSSLRRRADVQSGKAFSGTAFGSRVSSQMTGRESKPSRNTLASLLASVEGHTGDPVRRVSICSSAEHAGVEPLADTDEDASSSGSEDERA